uniref:Transposase n=1 Tax=Macrostomum lignano TaxID=282301 RepID=A0A1I8FV85_9PLAT
MQISVNILPNAKPAEADFGISFAKNFCNPELNWKLANLVVYFDSDSYIAFCFRHSNADYLLVRPSKKIAENHPCEGGGFKLLRRRK